MTYEEALVYKPSRVEGDILIKEHGLDPRDFWDDVGKKTIVGADVLLWLGY